MPVSSKRARFRDRSAKLSCHRRAMLQCAPACECAISHAFCHNNRVMAATSGADRCAPVERWSSVVEICEYLGVSRDTIYRWIADRGMPAHRLGRLWKF